MTPLPQPYDVTLRRVFAAPREKIFAAWTTPDLIRQWMGQPNYSGQSAQVDLTVGGKYRLELISDSGDTVLITGTYQEISPPQKLVYTWVFDDTAHESLITVEFNERGATTEVLLLHERIPDAPTRDGFEAGWLGCFEGIDRLLGIA